MENHVQVVRVLTRHAFWCALVAAAILDAQSIRAQQTAADPPGLGGALRNGLIISGATTHRLLHFTFDDGPDLHTTPLLLNKLDAVGVKATFFFSASRFRAGRLHHAQAADLARDVLKRGHSVGVHSVDHRRMFRMSPQDIGAQLDQAEHLFIQVFGFRTWLFRPPWGSHSAAADRLLAERGYTVVLWNICAADWVARPVTQMVRTWGQVLAKIEQTKGHRGGVVLLHDTHPWTVEVFDLIFQEILRRNCQLLERGQELYDITEDLAPFFSPREGSGPSQRAPAVELDPSVLQARQARLKLQTEARCKSQ